MSQSPPPILPEITDRRFFGHPLGLAVLFFAEMWERFSYYGMRALLTFYLTKHWLYSDGDAGVIYGAYTALVYITPVLGGYLADRYLGQRKAVVFGAVLLTLGHFFMGFEGSGSVDGIRDTAALNTFWLALAFIIVGSGFLKANISVIVGQLYPITDVRRDGAYTIFYMGINLGAAGGALLCGWLGETYGWSYGFGAAGVGMLLGLIVFVWGRPLLLGRGEPPSLERLSAPVAGIKFEWLLYALGLGAVGACWFLVQHQDLVGTFLGISGAALVIYVMYTAVYKLTPVERSRIFAALFLIFGSILFWALFEQAGSSLSLLTDRIVDREMAGFDVPASMFQSINAIYIILLAPLFAMLWTVMGRRGVEPSAPAKFGLGMVQLGAGFLVLVLGAKSAGMGEMIPVVFIFLIYLLHTTGELCLSPVGLSAMNRLAPAHLASIIMGTWFFASATGNFVAGLIASASGSSSMASLAELPEGIKPGSEAAEEFLRQRFAAGSEGAIEYVQTVTDVYSTIGWVAVGAGVLTMIIAPFIKRMMHLESLENVDHAMAGESELAEPQAAGIDTRGETK